MRKNQSLLWNDPFTLPISLLPLLSYKSIPPSLSIYYPSLHNPFHLSLLSHCIQQILESVHHCHVNGIVHRDLKVCMTKSIAANSDNMNKEQFLEGPISFFARGIIFQSIFCFFVKLLSNFYSFSQLQFILKKAKNKNA